VEIKRDYEGKIIQGFGVCVILPEREYTGPMYVGHGDRLVAWRSGAIAWATLEEAQGEIRARGIEESTSAQRYVATAYVCAIY